MKKTQMVLIGLLFLFTTWNGWALDLDAARKAGKIVELPSGYVKATDGGAEALAKEINEKRKKAYEAIAEKTKTTIEVVGQQAAEKIKKKLEQ
ncbi:MAG: DUF1318 domain-containing protein [Bdellovibrionales bacterium]|nr:DUF1318 domain-containing protein [Bdellovibrionales bacterium]